MPVAERIKPVAPDAPRAATGGCSVAVSGLSYRYGRGALALDAVGFRIPPSARWALVGVSGSGKSTLMQVLAGLRRPTAGNFELTVETEPDTKPRVSMLFQGMSHFPFRRVESNIRFGLRRLDLSREDRDRRVRELCSQIGLPVQSYGSRFLHDLSGGEARRVELAMALAPSPHLLLLDEPTTGLDYLVVDSVRELIESVVLEHRPTTLVVTHDIEEAVRLGGEKILILDGGELVAELAFDLPSRRASRAVTDDAITVAIESVRARMVDIVRPR